MKFKDRIKYSMKYVGSSAVYYITMGCYILLVIWAFFILKSWHKLLFGDAAGLNPFGIVVRTVLCIGVFSFVYMITKWSGSSKDRYETKLFYPHLENYGQQPLEQDINLTTDKPKEESKIINQNKKIESEKILSSDEINKHMKAGPKDPLSELDKMIGMESVKKQIHRLIAQFQFEKERAKDGIVDSSSSCNHMVFLGPAGTGKTTIARIMTSILYQNGYIKENKMIEITGSQLTGVYLGQTKEKTKLYIEAALGGVLFLDEAYSLDSSGNRNAYNEEATATLVKAMEDYKNEFILIVAGYKEETNRWLSSNEGLKSRIKLTIDFPNYTPEECVKIFESFVSQKQLSCEDALKKEYKDYISAMINISNLCKSYHLNIYSFGNARTVRNNVDKIKEYHAEAYIDGKISPENRDVLMQSDMTPLREEYRRVSIEFDRFLKERDGQSERKNQ